MNVNKFFLYIFLSPSRARGPSYLARTLTFRNGTTEKNRSGKKIGGKWKYHDKNFIAAANGIAWCAVTSTIYLSRLHAMQ